MFSRDARGEPRLSGYCEDGVLTRGGADRVTDDYRVLGTIVGFGHSRSSVSSGGGAANILAVLAPLIS